MGSSPSSDVTRWLHEWSAGDPSAADRLLPVIYRELHRLAEGYLSRERQGLHQACTELDHAFWPDDVSLRDDQAFDFGCIHGHNQITDVYLLAMAVHHRGYLVTFDQAIALSAVRGAISQHLRLL